MIRPEVGKRYRTMGGREVRMEALFEASPSREQRWAGKIVGSERLFVWNERGKALAGLREHYLDLIECIGESDE